MPLTTTPRIQLSGQVKSTRQTEACEYFFAALPQVERRFKIRVVTPQEKVFAMVYQGRSLLYRWTGSFAAFPQLSNRTHQTFDLPTMAFSHQYECSKQLHLRDGALGPVPRYESTIVRRPYIRTVQEYGLRSTGFLVTKTVCTVTVLSYYRMYGDRTYGQNAAQKTNNNMKL